MALGDSVKLAVYNAVQVVGDDAQLRNTTLEYEPQTGSEVATDETTTDVKVTPPEKFKLFEVQNLSVQFGDVKLLLPSYNIATAPLPGWELLHFGAVLKIVTAEPITISGVVLAWILQCRR